MDQKYEMDGPEDPLPPLQEVVPGTEAAAATEVPATIFTEETNNDMEVHHHSHEHHGRKTWKNYFWEFLMLFLAVFCGFLAEYKLEHVIENQREKVFIQSLVEDLENDRGQLDNYVVHLKEGLGQMDSLITLLNDEKNISANGNLLYYYGRMSPRLNFFRNNNRTFDQLKNSGGFRLIRNTGVSSAIMEYYGSLEFIRHLEALYFGEFEEYKKLASGIYDPLVLRSMEMPDGNISRQANDPALQTSDPHLLKQLSVFAVYMNGSRRSLIPAAAALQKKASDLIALLKKSYPFGSE